MDSFSIYKLEVFKKAKAKLIQKNQTEHSTKY